MLAAEAEIDGPFAVINADDFYGAESYAVLSRFLRELGGEPRPGGLVGFRVAETLTDAGPGLAGLLDVDDEGRLRGIRRDPRGMESRTIASSCYHDE